VKDPGGIARASTLRALLHSVRGRVSYFCNGKAPRPPTKGEGGGMADYDKGAMSLKRVKKRESRPKNKAPV